MAESERLGASFSIDTTDLKAGLQQANRLIRESESEFKAAAAGMEDWSSSADGLTARNKHLLNAIDLQRKKVNALQSEYDRLISEGLDPASKQAVELRTKINNETTALNKNEKELEENSEALEKLNEESKNASKSSIDLKDSSDKVSKGFSGLKKVAGIASIAIGAVAAAAVAGIKSLLNLAESTRELRNEMARLETGFTQAGLSAEDATKTYDTLYSVLGDTGKASEAASHLALLANNSEDLSKWTDIATGVYATFGDSLPIEGLTEAANETAKTGQLTGVLADALNWAGVNEEDFQKKLDATTSEQERQALITDTLNGLYDDTAQKFKETNKEVIAANEATNNLAKAQADLGAAVEPLNTKFTELKTSLLTELSPSLHQIISDLTEVFNGVQGAPERLANTVSEMLSNITEKIIEYLPKFVEFATQLVFMFGQTIIEQLPAITEAAIEMFSTFLKTLGDMSPSLIMTITDSVILMAETLIDNVDMIVDSGIKLMQGLANGLIEAIPQITAKIPTIISSLLNAILTNLPKLLDAGVKLLLELGNGLIKAIPDLLAQLPTIISEIVKGLLTDGIPALLEAGGQLLMGLLEGMLNPKVIWEYIKKIGNGIVEGFKNFFGIHSPSRLMKDKIGSFMGIGIAEGIGEGFEDSIKDVNKAMVKSLEVDTPSLNVKGSNKGQVASGGVVVNQYNTYSSAHSRYELFKSKQETAAAVRLAVGGKI